MDNRTMIVLLSALAMIGGGIYFATQASVKRTELNASAKVEIAQEHTKRAEGRHQLLDFLGLVRK